MTATLYDIAARHGFSNAAAAVAVDALRRGIGGMAQSDHPDLGQRLGTRVMVGRGGDADLTSLFADPDAVAAAHPSPERNTTMEPMKPMEPMRPMTPMKPMAGVDVDAPKEWGEPSSTGGQNDVKYAYFPGPKRLVVERDGRRTVYDTADHRITGVAQNQSDARAGKLVFTSQNGTVATDSLKQV